MVFFQGQFNFAAVIIQPLDHNTNRVVVKVKDELKELLGLSEPKIVSDQNVAILARQLALHANVRAIISETNIFYRDLKNVTVVGPFDI